VNARRWARSVLALGFAQWIAGCSFACPPGNRQGAWGCHVPCEDLPSAARARCTTTDAGAGDAIASDATAQDAGSTDATAQDAGASDAIVRDAEATDAMDDVRMEGAADGGGTDGGDASARVDPGLAAPRPVAPMSSSTVTSQRPTMRWVNDGASDGAVVELSRTRDFARIERTLGVTGARARPERELDPGVWFWRLRGRASTRGIEGANAGPTWWFRVGFRSADGGRDVSAGAELDLNGDGYTDLAVGVPSAEGQRGRVDVFYGGPTGLGATAATVLRGSALGDQFGTVVANAGDLNGDGFIDLVVLAPTADPDGTTDTGTASVFLGAERGLATLPARVIGGTALRTFSSGAATGAGDVNGDGYGDLALGAPSASAPPIDNCGAVDVHHGSALGVSAAATVRITGAAIDERFGFSIAGFGDYDGDGLADVAVGAPYAQGPGGVQVGAVRLFLGSPRGLPTAPARELMGSFSREGFGFVVARGGDVNGDGRTDLLVTATSVATVGAVRLWLGAEMGIGVAPSLRLDGATVEDRHGLAVASVGDVDRDGYADVAIAADLATVGALPGAGRVDVHRGGPGGLTALAAVRLSGSTADAHFGTAFGGAADFDGDGHLDLAIGADGVSDGGRMNAGSVWIFRGTPRGIDATTARVEHGMAADDRVGRALAWRFTGPRRRRADRNAGAEMQSPVDPPTG
jgi:hypothetical protein